MSIEDGYKERVQSTEVDRDGEREAAETDMVFNTLDLKLPTAGPTQAQNNSTNIDAEQLEQQPLST